MTEIFGLSPTNAQMLVTIRSGDQHAKTDGQRAQVQRVSSVNAGRS